MSKPLVHVVFGESAGGALRQALKQAGIAEQILPCPDRFALGPIDGGSVQDRMDWVRYSLPGVADDRYYLPTPAEMGLFWEQFHDAVNKKVIWFSRRVSNEYCCFLECLQRADSDDQLLINDFTSHPPVSHLHPEELIGFYGDWEPLAQSDREKYLREWSLLRSENSAFRVLADGRLVSAPIEFFDEQILSNVKDRWRKAARVVGETMALNWHGDYYNDVGDLVLLSRLNYLVDQGQVLARGNRTKMRGLEVRSVI